MIFANLAFGFSVFRIIIVCVLRSILGK
jgi:hypothetical protein